jgi:glycosyltransferase involved in cell wall biosynthesis
MTEPSRPLRVLRVIARLNVGGPALHTVILNEGLRQRGFDTLLVYGSVGAQEASFERMARTRALPVEHVPQLGRRISFWDDARALGKLLALLWRWTPDIVHTHTAKAGTLGRIAAVVYNTASRRSRRCAVVHTFHGHVLEGYFGPLGSAAVRAIERMLARVTDRIVTISVRQHDDITRRFRIAAPAKVTIVPLGLELGSLLALAPRASGHRPDAPGGSAEQDELDELIVGYVGRLVPIKDLQTLIRGVALARAHVPQIRLVIAGDGDERPALEACVMEVGLAGRVDFLGWRGDLPALYETMDVFVLTSINEGTPVSLIEAMAAGVPVVASAVGGVPDVVEDGVTGVLIPPRQPEAVAAAIVEAVLHPERASLMAARARSSVRERFDSARLVKEIEAMYRQTLAETRGPAAVVHSPLDGSTPSVR